MRKLWIAVGLLAAAMLATGLAARALAEPVAVDWQSQGECRRVSVYYDPHTPVTQAEMEGAAQAVAAACGEENGSPLLAWGGSSQQVAEYRSRRAETTVYRVSQDFFRLYRFAPVSGSVYTFGGSSAVLNWYAAWALFGSDNCAGQFIAVDGHPYQILAVLDTPDDTISRAAYGDTPMIFLPIGEEDPVTFCEAVLPEPVDGFAMTLFQESMPQGHFVDVSGQFALGALLQMLGEALDCHTQHVTFSLPPWAFVARQTGKYLLMLWGIFAAEGIACLAVLWAAVRKTVLFLARRRKSGR